MLHAKCRVPSLVRVPLVLFTILCAIPLRAQTLELRLDRLDAPGVLLKGLTARVSLSGRQPLQLHIREVRASSRRWENLSLRCAATHIGTDVITCDDGYLDALPWLTVQFRYHLREGALELVLAGRSGERWRVKHFTRGATRLAEIEVSNGDLTSLAFLLPAAWPRLTAGRLDAHIRLSRDERGRLDLAASGRMREVAFGDAAGLHAGEGIEMGFSLNGRRESAWRGAGELVWERGELFWSPFYLGQQRRRLLFRGAYDGRWLDLSDAHLTLEGIGDFLASGRWDMGTRRIQKLRLTSDGLAIGPAYDLLVRPLLAGSVGGALSLAGRGRGGMEIDDGRVVRVDLDVENGAIFDDRGMLALEGIDAHLPWRAHGPSQGRFAVRGGRLRALPLKSFATDVRLDPEGAAVDRLDLPVLDGSLQLANLSLRGGTAGWEAAGEASLRPVSMESLSTALGWPRMHGSLSAVIPRVSWRSGLLSVDGALLFRIFDGTAVVKDLRVEGLPGPVTRSEAEVDMRGLDLDLLTRTFSFGRIEGRVDVVVRDLLVENGRPLRFSASVASSPGDYPRRISQRAVDDIAALGGGSASAALQKSFLRLFEDFRYRRIGLAGRLERNVLTLSGLAARDGGFLIVEGGGIPALSVIGYNRQVDWNELVKRLARIRQGAAPVVK
ncbi:hypothetical protein [Thiobacter aerophilum]|uniref:Dicarboxylate transport domain-containing protein n=1 Tax=Thiobacter aerophilum TaxID=3121275 RepID=A0ABV0EGN6_9BURK